MEHSGIVLLYPEDGKVHANDKIRFSLHIDKDNDSAFDEIDRIDFELRSMKQKSHFKIAKRKVKPALKDQNEIEYIWKVDRHLREGIYEAKAIVLNKDGNVHEDLTKRIEPTRIEVLPARGQTQQQVHLAENTVVGIRPAKAGMPIQVALQETNRIDSPDQLLWILIRDRTVKYDAYETFIDSVMCFDKRSHRDPNRAVYAQANRLPFHNVASYSLLKYATEFFLMQECGLVPAGLLQPNASVELLNQFNTSEERGRTARTHINMSELRDEYLKKLTNGSESTYSLPYLDLIRQKLHEIPLKKPHEIAINDFESVTTNSACYGILKTELLGPCLMELIWSYWHEEGGLVQTMNAISRRFQNVRSGVGKDPLANLNLDPLRPLNNLLWGYIEDERNRLSISRRNLEYQYEYGISMIGKAVPQVNVVEHRTDFIRAFHSLLKACVDFYNQANFTTVIPDGFPLLNHLREVHLLLAEGAHNQYGDLPWTSRIEMLIQQWLLSRPEMREFIGGRIMVPYAEPWMDKVDTMKGLQGWSSTNITHFHDLGVFGEQLLLSIRFGNWNSTTGVGATNAANWAYYWRNEVQRYVHAYSAVTGVDLGAENKDSRGQALEVEDRFLPPALLMQKQEGIQKSRKQYSLQASMARPGGMQHQGMMAPALQANQKKLDG
ncbi:hypothetical protein ACXYMU_08395 [Pontibacter sp. CAU 1760]